MSNLYLWKKVEKTQEDLISEKISDDGLGTYKTIPSIDRIKKATELFGIYGKEWGLKNVKHSELMVGEYKALGLIDCIFFVEGGEHRTEFEIGNSIGITTYVNGKTGINTFYRKALESDTINKALSRLGFNADIYSDNDLVREVDNEEDNLDLIRVGKDKEKKVGGENAKSKEK